MPVCPTHCSTKLLLYKNNYGWVFARAASRWRGQKLLQVGYIMTNSSSAGCQDQQLLRIHWTQCTKLVIFSDEFNHPWTLNRPSQILVKVSLVIQLFLSCLWDRSRFLMTRQKRICSPLMYTEMSKQIPFIVKQRLWLDEFTQLYRTESIHCNLASNFLNFTPLRQEADLHHISSGQASFHYCHYYILLVISFK